jgi:predicted kinase
MKTKIQNPTLTLMCGLARCGKSTWIKKNKKDAIVVSPDKVRSDIFGHQFHANAEDFVWACSKAFVRLLLDQGKSVIIDATNLTFKQREPWIRMAQEFDIKLRIVWIKTSLKICKIRNDKSEVNRKVPVEVLDRMALSFENPDYMDCNCIEGKGKNKFYVELIEVPYKKKRCNYLN